jgi:glycoprotein endo-alpha-1,2-mannosidase
VNRNRLSKPAWCAAVLFAANLAFTCGESEAEPLGRSLVATTSSSPARPEILRPVGISLKGETIPHQVLAFFYDWYGTPAKTGRWLHWGQVNIAERTIRNSRHFPLDGPYDSHDHVVIERQMSEAEDAGITGFIVDWWGPETTTDFDFDYFLEAALRHHLVITVTYETQFSRTNLLASPSYSLGPHTLSERVTKVESDMHYLIDRYARKAAWLKVNGIPVVFLYKRALVQIPYVDWGRIEDAVATQDAPGMLFIADDLSAEAARIFSGIHTFGITKYTAGLSLADLATWAQTNYAQDVDIAHDKISCLTVIAGFDDSELLDRKPPRPITDRRDTQTYRVLWQAAIAADPDWILISTWNEWHEGSEIEPSVEFGGTALQETGTFARQFLPLPLRSH